MKYIIYILLLFSINISAQTDTVRTILIDRADETIFIRKSGNEVIKLLGNVELRQDSIYMYCDSAVIRNESYVEAVGNVIIQQGDSLNIFSDSLNYNGKKKIADLFGNVILQKHPQKLFTEKLNYNMSTKIATYPDWATLTDDTTQLRSKRGYYFVNTDEAFFKDSVSVISDDFSLRTDTLKYTTQSKVASFLSPTRISIDSSRIYCETGFYDTRNKIAEFRGNPQFQKGKQKAFAEIIKYDGAKNEVLLNGNAHFIEDDKTASADIIRYDEKNETTFLEGNASYSDNEKNIKSDLIIYDAKTEKYSTKGRSIIINPPQILEADEVDFSGNDEIGFAKGNVYWQDTSANMSILCREALYNKDRGYLKAFGGSEKLFADSIDQNRPLLITEMDNDSLYIVSDTLISFEIDSLNSDTNRVLIAYYDVRVFKNNLQATCDSLTYNSMDSLFRFYKNPLIWSDTTQFSADSINVLLADNKINKIFLKTNSFIINSPDEIFFNQIKGKNIIAFFAKNELRKMRVSGNAETIYYVLDEEKAYVGLNKTICSEMMIFFGDNKVDNIRFYEQPKGEALPMHSTNHDAIKLKGFMWNEDKRPKSIAELFSVKKQKSEEESQQIGEKTNTKKKNLPVKATAN